LGGPEHDRLDELRQTNAGANLLMEMAVLYPIVLLSVPRDKVELPMTEEFHEP